MQNKNPGNLLLTNGRIFTGPPWKIPVDALAVQNGKVVAFGDEARGLRNEFGADEIINCKGAMVLPGFIDSHLHLANLGESLSQLSFPEKSTAEEIRQAVAREVNRRETGEWIVGGKWNRQHLGGFPDRSLLDPVSPENPVALRSRDMHSLLLNSRAIESLDIAGKLNSSLGKYISRDGNGAPTGILQEDTIRIFEEERPQPTPEELRRFYQQAGDHCLQHGITSVHSIERIPGWRTLRNMHSTNKIPIRTGVLLPIDALDAVIEAGEYSGHGDNWLWTIGMKIFTDGALGSQSAWMKEPYEQSDDYGMALTDPETFREQIIRAHENRLSLGIHAIGDAAVKMTLQALNSAQQKKDLLDRIEHLQVFDPADLDILPTNLTASVQPIHLFGDREPADRVWGERARYAYAFRALLDAGIRLAFGSDAPVEAVNPWSGILAAVERRKSASEPSWYPEEQLSLEESLTAYTANGATSAYRKGRLGSLDIGAYGDIVILNCDPWDIPATEYETVKPVMTILNGNVVYSNGTIG
ncbi:MAG: amidohydrolase [Candidatus Marinimicrobia bacterium]|nr:amidohydrolase [Candidatus Neomarinimicrobiota bacterium]MCF7829759.1 amidohydrolase [Candidatus Neomarinimicrobiota bacterium]MCF7881709.1 amidohydrolase [Candidatus Neomarinimicrobiota bacterium]